MKAEVPLQLTVAVALLHVCRIRKMHVYIAQYVRNLVAKKETCV